ncbi:MAG: serine acetyltransferase [Planctomycetota bacterium]
MSFESTAAARGWRLSCRLHARGWQRLAKLVKVLNFVSFRALLPPEAVLGSDLRMKHYGLGVVIHPNVTVGDRVTFYHQVTIAGESWIGSPHRVVIGDDVVVGVGAKIIPRTDRGLEIGANTVIGAGAVVTRDVPANHVAVGVPAVAKPREQIDG